MTTGISLGRLKPTDEQWAVLRDDHQHLVIEAAAGAAKTTTLALCIAQALQQRMAPQRLLVLTHTSAAVQAMAGALEKVGVPAALRNLLRRHAVLDFDSFSLAVLARALGSSARACGTPEQLRPYLQQAIEGVADDETERYPDEIDLGAFADHEGALRAFTRLKGRMAWQLERDERPLTPELADEIGESYSTLRVFQHYEGQVRWSPRDEEHQFRGPGDGVYDLACALHAGDLDAEALGRFELVLVDEMHDTNWAMFTVLQHLLRANPGARFIGVGDAEQVIHAAACADAGFMRDIFERWIAPRAVLRLSHSYRYGQQLAQAAQAVADKPVDSALRRETVVELAPWPVAQASLELALRLERLIRHDGMNPGDIAVLLRQPHQSVELELALLQRGVPYRSVGMQRCLARPAVLLVWGLAALARGVLAGIETAATREAMLSAMAQFLGAATEAAELKKAAAAGDDYTLRHYTHNQILRMASAPGRQSAESFIACCQQPLEADPSELSQRLMQALNGEQLALRSLVRRADADDAIEDMRATLRLMNADNEGIDAFLRRLNQQDQLSLQHRAEQRCVRLDTIEAVKGLEFEQVWMPGLDARNFELAQDDALERNLFYVGITRAKQRLVLMHDPALAACKPLQRLVDALRPASIASP
jgi:DNA helicase-2/ATP-dependent DNA helicase PcrA